MTQRLANVGITIVRGTFDFVTGYGRKEFKEADWLQRVIYLETIAGVPGMVAAMHRHMRSLVIFFSFFLLLSSLLLFFFLTFFLFL